jgi:hypothetical protein
MNNMRKFKHKITEEIAFESQNKYYTLESNSQACIPNTLIENDPNWEEIIELSVPIGTRFIVNKSGATVYTIFNIINKDKIIVYWNNDKNKTTYSIEDVNYYFKTKAWIEYKEPELKIGEFVFENNNGLATFGCQNFSISELKVIKRLLSYPIEGDIVIKGHNITREFIDTIISKIS